MQNAGFVQTRQFCHILHFVELWRIHFLYIVTKNHNTFAGFGQFHLDFVAILLLDAGCEETLRKRNL